jgi:hypothetical protein
MLPGFLVAFSRRRLMGLICATNYGMLTCLTRCESGNRFTVHMTTPLWTLPNDESNFNAMDVRRHERGSLLCS